jgi:hypothetical protein
LEEQSSNNKGHETRVFISYTREDYGAAKRLYQDLKDAGLNPWLEHSSIPPGQRWSTEIKNIIENSRYFIALLSSNSVDKRGSSERELKYAVDQQLEVPQSDAYIIPVRLDKCEIPFHLENISFVDLFPDWNKGFRKILLLMGLITEKEIEFTIEYGDVISFAADTVAVKYAQGFYGVSSAIAQSLDKIGIKWEDLRSQIGSYKYIDDTKGAIASHHALFVGTPPLLDFGYRQIREFSSIVLNILSNEDPDIKHLAMPIHGVGYGLDEVESVLSQFEGITDTMQTGKLPIYLKRISIVEANYARVQHVREALEKKLDNTEYA